MKKVILIFILIVPSGKYLLAQERTGEKDSSQWSFSADANFYLIPDDFFVLPIFRADKNKLHLEARYNYEERGTFSAWIGYNFSGGDDVFSYTFTPMLGGVFGESQGIAPGLEITMTYKNFELYSEMENLFFSATADSESMFYYNWADLSYSPTDWLWFGVSGQRTRLYQSALDIQRGLLVGVGLKRFEFNTYVYNIGDDPFLILTLSASF